MRLSLVLVVAALCFLSGGVRSDDASSGGEVASAASSASSSSGDSSGSGGGGSAVCSQVQTPTECNTNNCHWCSGVCTNLVCDCKGVPGGSEVVDACGVCGGNNDTCVPQPLQPEPIIVPACDDGVAMDACGVCGGDGHTCFHLSSVEYIGIILAICGNALISVSLSCQKHAHNTNEALGSEKVAYVTLRLWWIGQVLMVVGECGNFLAYAYAPATLVAPLGSVTVISNALIAHRILHEPLFARNIMGCVLAVLGSILIVLYAPQEEKQLTMELLVDYLSEPIFVVFMIVVVLAIVALFFVRETLKKRYVTIYVLICSLTGCITVMCTKALSTAIILTASGRNQFTTILPWVLLMLVVVTVAIQIRFLNLAMISFGASEVVPVYYVLFTFCSVLAGIVLFHEWHEPSPLYTLLFLVGCFMTFGGVGLITSVRSEDVELRRAALLERAGLLEDPDELWNEADDLDIWGSEDEESVGGGNSGGNKMRVLSA